MTLLNRGLLVFGFGLVLAGLNGCAESEEKKVGQATVSPDAPKSSEEAQKAMMKNMTLSPKGTTGSPKTP